jgi:hypothetical protein
MGFMNLSCLLDAAFPYSTMPHRGKQGETGRMRTGEGQGNLLLKEEVPLQLPGKLHQGEIIRKPISYCSGGKAYCIN